MNDREVANTNFIALDVTPPGDEIKKKSSPRKLLSQYQPNFVEMILGWPRFQNCVR
jgi:hypothetical protein